MNKMENLNSLKIEVKDILGTDRQVADVARTTIGLDEGNTPVKSSYMRKLYLCEHSPIRLKSFLVKVYNVPYWIVMHFVRHKHGIEHWVSTQRDDRTGIDREKLPQDALVDWEFLVNANELIYMARKRLCCAAHPKTRFVFLSILLVIAEHDEELVKCCVPDCIYRGHCYEHKSCGFHKTEEFQQRLSKYRKGINE